MGVVYEAGISRLADMSRCSSCQLLFCWAVPRTRADPQVRRQRRFCA